MALGIPAYYAELLRANPDLEPVFLRENIEARFSVLASFTGMVSVFFLGTYVVGTFVRRPAVLSLLIRKCYVLVYAWILLFAYVLFTSTSLLFREELLLHGMEQTRVTVFYLRWSFLWPALLVGTVVFFLHMVAWKSSTRLLFGGRLEGIGEEKRLEPALGDRFFESLRSHGPDPRFRKSLYKSGTAHLMVIVIIPLLMQLAGCVEPYRVPEGSGDPVVALVQVVQPERVEKQRLVLNPESTIYLHIPDFDESEVMQEVQEMTELTYEADVAATTGRMGRGGGTEGGWPDGMEDGLVRFIRLEYNGEGWDNAMGPGEDSDTNFLREFHRITGFPVRDRPESHAIRLLDRYDDGYAPPFVFMTGHGGISIPQRDIQILRAYLESGGMLFASAGSPQWDRNFRSLMRALFPGEPLRTIAHDDPIFQMPYTFPHGAPPLWHHGGYQSMGIRRGGRWVVFYHPGDIQDAWRTGYSGLSPEVARRAFEMGVNVIYYAFTNYLEETREARR
ncbi:MAG: DUF4159 domain-containing protein [Opitutales bacterium]|nr:DUF4159 domain-containing protein [Opitutales bacterium]